MLKDFKKIILLNEVINTLNIVPDGVYVDGTFGCGGHSKVILSYLNNNGKLFAIDRDFEAIQLGNILEKKDGRFVIIHGKFSGLFKYIKNYNLLGKVNGILLDLGVSKLQLENVARGFSFIHNGPLDMRMNVNCGLSASSWLRRASLKRIIWVLKTFGEERFAKRIAKGIVMYRNHGGSLKYTHELVKIIIDAIPYCDKYKHPATRTFQAIRIYINNELEEIKSVLKDSLYVLAPGGRLLVITFHSLEDRIVKSFIRQHILPTSISQKEFLNRRCMHFNIEDCSIYRNKNINIDHDQSLCYLKSIGKFFPSREEIKDNISARSAILRCVEKIVV